MDDAFNLLPPLGVGTFLNIGSIAQNGSEFSINNLPRRFGRPIKIPIRVEAFINGFTDSGTFTLTSPTLRNIPSGWKLTLVDEKTGKHSIISLRNPYSFKIEGPLQKAPGYTQNSTKPGAPRSPGNTHISPNIKSKSFNTSKPRFKLIIEPGSDALVLPSEFELKQNYPNPFNPSTTFAFDLPIQSSVTLEVFDILGRKIASVIQNKTYQAGSHEVSWNASALASGIYLYRINTSEVSYIKRMTLIK